MVGAKKQFFLKKVMIQNVTLANRNKLSFHIIFDCTIRYNHVHLRYTRLIKKSYFLKNVLRIKVNDEINIFDGITGEWESTVMSINRENTVLRVTNIINKIKKYIDMYINLYIYFSLFTFFVTV